MTELTIDQALQKGVEAHKSGQVQEADRLYTAILKVQPKHPDTNHNMGVLAVGVGKVEQALPFFKTALEANPATAQFWLSYIDALIKLDHLADAKAVFDQARSKGAKGDGFDKLEQRLMEAGKEPVEVSRVAAEQAPGKPNILDRLKLDQALTLAKRKEKAGLQKESKNIYQDILVKFPQNRKAREELKRLTDSSGEKPLLQQNPSRDQLMAIIDLKKKGDFQKALTQAEILARKFPRSFILFYMQGMILKELGHYDRSVKAYTRAIAIKPDYAEAYYNMANVLRDQGKLKQAIAAYKNATTIKPDYSEAFNNMGVTLVDLGELEQATEAYTKALEIIPNDADTHSNMGVCLEEKRELEQALKSYAKALEIEPYHAHALNNMGTTLEKKNQLDQAMECYTGAIKIKPYYIEAHNNLGSAFVQKGMLDQAKECYNQSLQINPNLGETHRRLSIINRYNMENSQVKQVEELMLRQDLKESDLCALHFTYAKMQEDIGNLSRAFDNFASGGKLRQKLLSYNFMKDHQLFTSIHSTAPLFKKSKTKLVKPKSLHTPIFILGMPRSGTTLIEQIISSHSDVTGAGELFYVSTLGWELATGQTPICYQSINEFREKYLEQLSARAEGNRYVTDKMPQNFRFIGLICAAFPEAKIIHVQRQAEATCWSNFKNYFGARGLGYSYSLQDTVKYFARYTELMRLWNTMFYDRIYNCDYDKLTKDQEKHIRKLIDYLDLNWDDKCLEPQKNIRTVKTASQHQIRKKIYKGSSQDWKKFRPFLGDIFNDL